MSRCRGYITLAALCIVGGLSCGSPTARIEDFVLGGRAELLAVDGQPVGRARSRYVTVVPVALVRPGRHAFLVRMRTGEGGVATDTLVVSATVVAGRRYRFEDRDGTLQLIEKVAKQ